MRSPVQSAIEISDVPELCSRLLRETNALAVMVLGEEGQIVGHAGAPGALTDAVVDGVGDAAGEVLLRAAARNAAPPSEADEQVALVGTTQVCAAPLGAKAVLVVVFDDPANLNQVKLRMKRARELLLRTLEAT